MQEINGSSVELPLTVAYDTISLGRLRFWIHMQDAVYSLQQFGKTHTHRHTRTDTRAHTHTHTQTHMHTHACTDEHRHTHRHR